VLHVFALMNRGGAETMIMNLYRNIDRSKIQFDFMVHTEEECAFDDEINKFGGKIFSVPAYEGRNHISYKKSWEDFFKNHPEYKIIHGHVRSTASIYLKIAKKYGLTTIAHSHSTSSGTGFLAIAKNILQYPIRYTADYLFACSESAGVWLFGKRACKKDNFFILNNAIDTKKFIFNSTVREEIRKEFQIKDKFVIGHVGRLHAQKNHMFLIDIFKEVHDRNKNAILMLVGDGELRHSIEKKIKKLGLSDSVIFTGVRLDIPELLQAMDMFLFPSLHEGLPVTLVEAQASGLKILASDTITKEIAFTDLVNFYSLRSSPKKWAVKALNSLNRNTRQNYLTEIKNANYDIEENAKWLENFYLTLYSNSKKGVNNG